LKGTVEMKSNFKGEKEIMKNLSRHCSMKISSDFIMNAYRNKSGIKKMFFIPMAALTIMLALFMTGCAGLPTSRNIDKTDYPFVNDPEVIGKWEAVDFVKNQQDFTLKGKSWDGELFLKSLVFIKEGKMLCAVETEILAPSSFSWSKDMILNKEDKTLSKYEIKKIDGASYLFFEWKNGDYIFHNMKPSYYVLKKVDSNDYSDFKPLQIVEDKVDFQFIDDQQMIGQWQSVDFVQDKEKFKPGKKDWRGDLYLTEMKFDNVGIMTYTTTKRQSSDPAITWAKGFVLNRINKTASKCEIREMEGSAYMFYEWKSGDYFLRGMKPSYYVLKKVDEIKMN
jgi:bla regulator protein blaR1